MKVEKMPQLPSSWLLTTIETISEVNPKLDRTGITDDLEVSFVPMPAVEAETGRITVSGLRKFSEVKKGYTSFQEDDVLFAKITPCMENGKMAIVPPVSNGIGFGSTEFHVLRSYKEIDEKYVYYNISSKVFRADAEHNMTGAVGQRRVPTPYLSGCEIPLPPTNEQHRIAAKIEELFSELDKGIESLKTARAQLKVYRQALLKHAFEGKLTEQWRKDNADKLETADELLVRIQKERDSILKNMAHDGDAEAKRFLKKMSKNVVKHPVIDIPNGATWASFLEFCTLVVDCHNKTAPYQNEGIYLIRTPCIRGGKIDLNDEARFISQETYEYWSRRCPPMPGDIILTREAPMGEAGIVPSGIKLCMGQRMMLLRPPSCMDSKYLLYSILDPLFQSRLVKDSVGTGVKHLRVGDVEKLCVPLFPLEEQRQIVDLIESNLSIIHEQERDIERALQQSEALRQSILEKAFSGQLVPQDPNDEPAFILLERIRAEKVANSEKIKQTKPKNRKKRKTAA